MKQTTINMIDQAMQFNVDVQEDCLNLQEMKNHLLQTYRDLKLNQARGSFESLHVDEVPVKTKISQELLDMMDSSITDLDKKINYAHFVEVPDKSAIMYNYNTIWNMATCFKEMLMNLIELSEQNLSYESFKSTYLETSEMNLGLTNTHIEDSDYTTMNVPQPKMQSTSEADMNKENLNNAGRFLNNVIDQDILTGLSGLKYKMSEHFSEDPEDAIKLSHFISQIIMSVKNSLILIKNYHAATLNELQ